MVQRSRCHPWQNLMPLSPHTSSADSTCSMFSTFFWFFDSCSYRGPQMVQYWRVKLTKVCTKWSAKHVRIQPNIADCRPLPRDSWDKVPLSCTDTGGLCPKLRLVNRADRKSIAFTLFFSSPSYHICTKSVLFVHLHKFHGERTVWCELKNKTIFTKTSTSTDQQQSATHRHTVYRQALLTNTSSL